MLTHQTPITRNNVRVIGKLDATRTIVFVHGFGTDQEIWSEVSDAFLGEFRIVLLDHVGAGGSAPEAFIQSRYLNLRPYAADLIEVADALSLENLILVGHSAGAMIALLAANARPLLVSQLILIGASPRYLNDTGYHGGFSEADLSELYGLMVGGYKRWADQFAALAMGNPNRPQLARRLATSLKSLPPDHALTVLCSIFQSDYRSELPLVTSPTLIIQSKEDFAVPLEIAEYLHAQIRSSRLAVINATGHFPHLSAPDEVIKAVRTFIGQ